MITTIVKDPLAAAAAPEKVQLDAASQVVYDYAVGGQLLQAVEYCERHAAAIIPTRGQLALLKEVLREKLIVLQLLIVAAQERASAKQAADEKRDVA